jgi:hypothetical protein
MDDAFFLAVESPGLVAATSAVCVVGDYPLGSKEQVCGASFAAGPA